MENMKAIRVHNYDGPDVTRFEDAPRQNSLKGCVSGIWAFAARRKKPGSLASLGIPNTQNRAPLCGSLPARRPSSLL
jgi:hypothetical protein